MSVVEGPYAELITPEPFHFAYEFQAAWNLPKALKSMIAGMRDAYFYCCSQFFKFTAFSKIYLSSYPHEVGMGHWIHWAISDCMDIIEDHLRVWVPIPIQSGSVVHDRSAADSGVIQVEVRPATGDFPGSQPGIAALSIEGQIRLWNYSVNRARFTIIGTMFTR
jgi:hypothetical protein